MLFEREKLSETRTIAACTDGEYVGGLVHIEEEVFESVWRKCMDHAVYSMVHAVCQGASCEYCLDRHERAIQIPSAV